MNGRLFGLAGCLGMGLVGLALAQDSTDSPTRPLVYPKDKSQRETAPLIPKTIRQPLPPRRAVKLKSLNTPISGKNPVANQAIAKFTPMPVKNQLVDQKGQPVTLWPAGRKKHYSTLYEDK